MKFPRFYRFPSNGLNPGGTVCRTGRCIVWHVGPYVKVHVDTSQPGIPLVDPPVPPCVYACTVRFSITLN